MRAVLLLTAWQIKNALRSSLTDPRRLVPLLGVVIVFAMQIVNGLVLAAFRPPMPSAFARFLTEHVDLIGGGVFLLLLLMIVGLIDYGLSEGFLAFTLADVDYLFPAPIPRRAVLAYRLAGVTLVSFYRGSFLFAMIWWYGLTQVALYRGGPGAALVSVAALFFCLGGYTNLALVMKLVFGFGRLALLRRWLTVLLVLGIAALAFAAWRYGVATVLKLAQHWVPAALFYPCRLASDAVVAPLTGHMGWVPTGELLLFYLLTLTVVFSRDVNFYEASLAGSERIARISEARREHNWSALFAIQAEGRRRKTDGRLYTIPAFGRGAGALFWAHMAAAAKRPFANFWLPLLGGPALSVGTGLWVPHEAVFLVSGLAGYLLFILMMSGAPAFRQTLLRQGLVRPLPLDDWQVVLADVLPRVLPASLFALSAGFSLLATRAPFVEYGAFLLVVCAPPAVLWLCLLQYTVATWYPNAQDKLQQMLSGIISLFLSGLTLLLALPFVLLPMLLRAPGWLSVLLFLIPAAVLIGLGLLTATLSYRRFEPKS
jgi:hypothetical protein